MTTSLFLLIYLYTILNMLIASKQRYVYSRPGQQKWMGLVPKGSKGWGLGWLRVGVDGDVGERIFGHGSYWNLSLFQRTRDKIIFGRDHHIGKVKEMSCKDRECE